MSSLYEETVRLLNSRTDIAAIAAATNLQYDWVIKLKRGDIKDPSVNKIQTIYEHLSGKPLMRKEEK